MWILTGNVGATTASVSIRVIPPASGPDKFGEAQLRYSVFADFQDSQIDNEVEDLLISEGGHARFSLSNLVPYQQYYVRLIVDGQETTTTGSFKTFKYSALSYKFAVGSDVNYNSNADIFRQIHQFNPDMFIHLGDSDHALDNSDPSEVPYWNSWTNVMNQSNQALLFSNRNFVRTWDDHDYGPNNSDKNNPARAEAISAYDNIIPHYGFGGTPATDGIYQSFRVGRVRFLLLDTRSNRDPFQQAEPKTMLGATQLAWLKQELIDFKNEKSTQNNSQALIILSSVPWVGKDSDPMPPSQDIGEGWHRYENERTYITNYITTNSIPNVLFLTGDSHNLAIDDGRNQSFPVMEVGTLDSWGNWYQGKWNINDSDFSGGPYPALDRGFGLVRVDDEDENWIRIRLENWGILAGRTQVQKIRDYVIDWVATGPAGTPPTLNEEVGTPFINDGTGNIYNNLKVNLYAVTDAEYLQESITATDKKVFDNVINNVGFKLAKLEDTEKGKVFAESVTKTNIARSYILDPDDPSLGTSFERKGYMYDVALALICNSHKGNLSIAERLVDGIIDSQSVSGGIPFSVDQNDPTTADHYYRNGATAWVAYGLCFFLEYFPTSSKYADAKTAMENILTYLETYRNGSGLQSNAVLGGKGKYNTDTWVFDPNYIISWASTEHNIDSYFAFKKAYEITGTAAYLTTANEIRDYLNTTCWDSGNDRFYQGVSDSTTIDTADALDVNSWGYLFLDAANLKSTERGNLLQRCEDIYLSEFYIDTYKKKVSGYKPYSAAWGYPSSSDLIWFEGSFGVACAYHRAGIKTKYKEIMQNLRILQEKDGSFRYSNAGGNYEISKNKSLASTCWFYIAAEMPDLIFV